MVGHRCASYAEFQVTGLTRVKISQGYLHDIAIVFIFMLLFVQKHYYYLVLGAIIYRLEHVSTVGLMEKAVPQWVTLLNLILLGQLRR